MIKSKVIEKVKVVLLPNRIRNIKNLVKRFI